MWPQEFQEALAAITRALNEGRTLLPVIRWLLIAWATFLAVLIAATLDQLIR